MSLAKDIKNLCKRFQGNIYLALEHLRGLVDLVTIISDREVAVEGVVPDTFEGKTMIFKSTTGGFLEELERNPANSFAPCSEPIMMNKPRSDGLFIEYMWEIDLDDARFGFGTSNTAEVIYYWPWRALYLLDLYDFQNEAETQHDMIPVRNTCYRLVYGIIRIQTAVRRFLAGRKALAPPDGILYLVAKRRFEAKMEKMV
eukprot:gene27643-33383_t